MEGELSPLDCIFCKSPLTSPVLLDCLHTVCSSCAPACSEECSKHQTAVKKEFVHDEIAQFLIDASQERTECCANCDAISQPMFFCETCQQCLCSACKTQIHSAKMFLKHQVINAEDRIVVRTEDKCKSHGELYMSFDFSTKKLLCFKCFNAIPQEQRETIKSIEVAQSNALEKLASSIQSLKIVQETMGSELKNASEIAGRHTQQANDAISSVNKLCDELVDTINKTRDKIVKKIEVEKIKADVACEMYKSAIKIMQDPIRLCLLGGQILPCISSPIDVLNIAPAFILRVERLINKRVDAMPILQFNSNSLEERSELAKALEPYLGLSAAWCPISAVRDTVKEGSGSSQSNKSIGRFSNSFSYSDAYALKTSLSFSKLSNYNTGSFAQHFGKVELPVAHVIQEILDLSARVQEVQRDLTIRRCLVKPDFINTLAKQCQSVEAKAGLVSSMLDNMQPDLQQIWQEALDNVRKQQILYREKVEEVTTLRATVREVLVGAKQLTSYAVCIENMSAVIDPKRTHPPDPAPMESICQQISTIEPDSDTRIAAIEKEEQHRRANQEAQRKHDEAQIVEKTVKGLKHGKQKRKDLNKFLLNTCRDRSPGGTDTALFAPIIRKSEKWEYSSDAESISMSESFDAWPDNLEVDVAKDEQARCSSSLSVPIPSPCTSNHSKSPADLMFTSTANTPTMHENMMQSLRDIFACKKETENQSNILASLVKFTQKKQKDGDFTDQEIYSAPESKANPSSPTKKQVRRRRRKTEAEQLDVTVESSLEPLSIPEVPFVPSSVFEASQSSPNKLGCFEAKEKVLQSLRDKIAESPVNDSASLTE